MKWIYISLFYCAVFIQASIAQQALPQLGKQNNAAVIRSMSLQQKVDLLVGQGMRIPGITDANQGPVVGKTEDKVPGAAGTTAAITALGIPTTVVADGPAGLRISPKRAGQERTYYATAFPIATLLASSWDTTVLYAVGKAMGSEAKAYGVDVILGPGMNIQRNALGGRNFEYYAEDPLVTGTIATAMVKGIQSNGIGTSVKHFAANNHETNRNTINVKVGSRALREIYLKGFEMVIKQANPWTVMSSYNKINGTYTSESPDLLKKILREDWGYKGVVMTDWFGGMDAVAQMKAGNELLMPGTPQQEQAIINAVNNGTLSESVLDENLDKLLTYIQLTQSFKGLEPSNTPDLKTHAVIARQAAAEGMVLLKNASGVLPMSAGKRIAAFGNFTYDLVSGGTGSGDVNEAYTISLPQGLSAAGIVLDPAVQAAYEAHIKAEKDKLPKDRPWFLPPPSIPELQPSAALIANATNADMAVITIGRISGEFMDRKKENDFYLSAAEQELITNVSVAFHAKGKKVVVVLNVGGVIETVSWRDKVDGILLAWLPGQEAGAAIADVLGGAVNPSGKLAVSFPVKFEDDPTAEGFPGKEYGEPMQVGFMRARKAEIEYKEGIFIGYRAFEKQSIPTAYPFGYGLSYTNFAYTNLKLNTAVWNGQLLVQVTVKNTGKTAGKEIVQLYIAAPGKDMPKPVKELKGFVKTRLLKPGESQTLQFKLDATALASFKENSSQWVAESGVYGILIGASSKDIRAKATCAVPKTILLDTVNKVLLPQ
jgi:beta-glucosidase